MDCYSIILFTQRALHYFNSLGSLIRRNERKLPRGTFSNTHRHTHTNKANGICIECFPRPWFMSLGKAVYFFSAPLWENWKWLWLRGPSPDPKICYAQEIDLACISWNRCSAVDEPPTLWSVWVKTLRWRCSVLVIVIMIICYAAFNCCNVLLSWNISCAKSLYCCWF